ncbi:MAG: hypothetical protein A3D92_04900 [Bacteroidetes bacterium RIFCSPHIGHO2_02_FULL_44_7]|nr:MAG: hypothetical protein A3D92_04900 [Bacteroidetes bacterium RIFCSPHIGHO2_02_FULL_44_7]
MKSVRVFAFTFIFIRGAFAQFSDTLLAEPPLKSAIQHQLWATEYYVHITSEGGTIPFLAPNGDTLAYCENTCDFCTACLEGTVFLLDSTGGHRVLNYASRSAESQSNCRECSKYTKSKLNVESWGSVRWKLSSGFGEGVKSYRLVPYRTVAVDPACIPYGTVLYIPEAKGVRIQLEDGNSVEHDGYFFAGDTGGAIKGNHIDVFTGTDASHPFPFVHSSETKTFAAFIVNDLHIIYHFKALHLK